MLYCRYTGPKKWGKSWGGTRPPKQGQILILLGRGDVPEPFLGGRRDEEMVTVATRTTRSCWLLPDEYIEEIREEE